MLKRFPLMLHVQYDASKKHTVYKAISKSGLVPTKKLLPCALLVPFHWNLALINAG